MLKEPKKAEKNRSGSRKSLGIHRWTFDEVEEEENLVALNLIPASKQLHEEWKAKIAEDFAKFGLEVPTSEFMQKAAEKEFTPNILDIFCANYSICKEPIQIVFGRKLEV